MTKPPRGQPLDQLLTAWLSERTPDIHELTKQVAEWRLMGQLRIEDEEWVDRWQARGLQLGLSNRLRVPRVASIRQFVAELDSAGHHVWTNLHAAIARNDATELEHIEAHAWSVITEGAQMIGSQRDVLLRIGRPVTEVDERIRKLLEAALTRTRAA
jgi:hypothetical protein